jgi:hypothetical protein
MHAQRALFDFALGADVAVEGASRGTAIDQLDAADFDDAMVQFELEAGGFGIENDLAH